MFYQFTITIGASARTPEEAYEKALIDLALNPHELPEYTEDKDDEL